MNRDFLSNFEKPTEQKNNTVTPAPSFAVGYDNIEYNEVGHNRVICFVWPDGQHHFFDYSRLDDGLIDAEQTMIKLFLGRDTVELVGIMLLPLFKSLMHHKRKYVYCDDARYNNLNDGEAVVNEIIITKNS